MNHMFAGQTKAGILNELQGALKNATVLPQYTIPYEEFINDKVHMPERVSACFSEDFLIVRSSSSAEDQTDQSAAGKYESILNVDKNDHAHLLEAIKKVFDSYEDPGDQEVLIQPMLENIRYSGVLFTCNIDTLAPYYVINYYEGTDSAAITGGKAGESKTFVQYKHAENFTGQAGGKEKFITGLLKAAREIEDLFAHAYLDIEFGVDQANDIYIFQVRPVTLKNKCDLREVDLDPVLYKIYKKVEKRAVPHPNLLGDRAFFGVMPDWNPAEIIGLRPKRLALSLYKELVTDDIWAVQRKDYGYRDLQAHPLLVTFLGIPYIRKFC